MNARHSSASSEHFTPPAIVEAARAVMRGIDLDPASCAFGNKSVRARKYYTQENNGFIQPWKGRVLLNPPGGYCDEHGMTLEKVEGQKGWFRPDTGLRATSQSSQKAWWFKLAREYVEGRVTEAVFVCFSIELLQSTQCDTPEGLPLPLDFAICFPRARVKYCKKVGRLLVVGSSPPHASCIVFLPAGGAASIARFERAFAPIGKCIRAGRVGK